MITADFDDDTVAQMRRILAYKETKYLRQMRQRLDESMFDRIKTIGIGAFGKVVLVKKVSCRILYRFFEYFKKSIMLKIHFRMTVPWVKATMQ